MSKVSEAMKLRGALGAIEKRRIASAIVYNEFDEGMPAVTFDAERTIVPNMAWDEGIITRLDIHVGAHYTVFRTDPPEAYEIAEKNAMRALSRCLYQDVLDDLIIITQLVGDSKRRQAMTRLNDLFTRLNGND